MCSSSCSTSASPIAFWMRWARACFCFSSVAICWARPPYWASAFLRSAFFIILLLSVKFSYPVRRGVRQPLSVRAACWMQCLASEACSECRSVHSAIASLPKPQLCVPALPPVSLSLSLLYHVHDYLDIDKVQNHAHDKSYVFHLVHDCF